MAEEQGAPISMKSESLEAKHYCSVWKIYLWLWQVTNMLPLILERKYLLWKVNV